MILLLNHTQEHLANFLEETLVGDTVHVDNCSIELKDFLCQYYKHA